MNEFLEWAKRMKAHINKKKKTLDQNLAQDCYDDGRIDMLQMCIDWFDPQKLKFDPKEAYDEL